MPAISLDVEGEMEHHKHWKWDPKHMNKVRASLFSSSLSPLLRDHARLELI